MYFSAIELRDWKAYRTASLRFPPPQPGRNVVLIGALNKHGKTSLLEALLVGLYGRDGYDMVSRLPSTDADGRQVRQSYPAFLQQALHARAITEGRSQMGVEVAFGGERQVRLQRIWRFTPRGDYVGESVYAFERQNGVEVDIVKPHFDDDKAFWTHFITNLFAAPSVAPFFLFDGEQVQKLANKSASAVVRTGIEAILGVPTLRRLRDDLDTYIRDNRVASVDGHEMTIARLEDEIRAALVRIDVLDVIRVAAEVAGDTANRALLLVLERINALGADVRDINKLTNERALLEARRRRAREDLETIVTQKLPLALVGAHLRKGLERQLVAETRLEAWEAGQNQGSDTVDALTAKAHATGIAATPALTTVQLDDVMRWIAVSWAELQHPSPADCAAVQRHSYLTGGNRHGVLQSLLNVERELVSSVIARQQEIRDQTRRIDEIDETLRTLENVSELIQELLAEERRASEQLAAARAKADQATREMAPLYQQVTDNQARISQLQNELEGQSGKRAAVDWARRIREMLDKLSADAISLYAERIGSELTRAYKGIAHTTAVDKINVDASCTVHVLNKGGKDVRAWDPSAGDNQILATSLIAAVVRATGKRLPIVIDTPLGRLDATHRHNLLGWFTNEMSEQIIFLSTNEEIVGDKLARIRSHVSKAYLVECEVHPDEGYGISKVREDAYFEPIARGPM